jgi:mannosidase alpha-like ER degradation enhancer 1
MDNYNNELLELSKELGDRLMPAFNTKTGIPWPRVNLLRGVLSIEVKEACTAGAGTLLIEFGTLSRLTGDPKYENAAKRALRAIFRRKSKLDLFGTTMAIQNTDWLESTAGIGASSDSFHEYLFKAYILFGNQEYLDMFKVAYGAILKHIKTDSGL